ncbi:zinc ribbon domain-containing protein [Angelakisella massiliensis]|uniref:zinc ribbon domain-containing protein n=1 Tax=Angelakisella massiliensis TaxID=1871018 RepID=UPI00097853C5|nr:zinc ribbon domain-containing protein [Angelakisella massiliensis]
MRCASAGFEGKVHRTLRFFISRSPRSTCPGCHGSIRPGDKFCGDCGAPLRETTCPSCGYHVRPGKKFCAKCGKNLLEKK